MPAPSSMHNVPARILHWSIALLVLGLIPVGFLMLQDWVSRDLRNMMFISHKNIGSLVLILILLRIANRCINPPHLKPVQLAPIQELAAKATHLGLYAMLLIMPLSGYVRVRAGGFPIEAFDALGVPTLVPRSDALAEFAKTVHYYAAYGIMILIAMHIGAAAFHGLVRKDGIFSRMWPVFGTGRE